MSYERVWYVVGGCAVVLGTCCAVVVLPASTAVVGACVGAASVALLDVVLRLDGAAGADVPRSASGHTSRAAWGAAGFVACLGLLVATPAAALPLFAVAGLSCPPLVRRLLRRTAPGPAAPAPSAPSASSAPAARPDDQRPAWPPPLDEVSDAVLCGLWTESYWTLRRSRSTEERIRLVELRARLLEEMGRRRPAAVADWLETDAQPHQRPRAFGTGAPPPPGWSTGEEGAA